MTDPQSPPSTSVVASRPERLLSIDALRGFDMFWIIGGDNLARAIGKWWGTPADEKFAEQFEPGRSRLQSTRPTVIRWPASTRRIAFTSASTQVRAMAGRGRSFRSSVMTWT